MAGRQFKFHDGETGAALAVRVRRSKKESGFVSVLRDGTIVVRLEKGTGDIDQDLIKFLARELNIPKKKFQIIAGDEGEKILISILDLEPELIQKRILERIP